MPHTDYLFELLPAVVRQADGKRGGPLRDLLRVIGEQADLLDDDIRRLYENLFIETAESWAIPYIGDLVGYRPLFVPPDDEERRALVDPRSAVAGRIGLNRRKGTCSVLDDLVAQTTGWSARVDDDAGGPLVAHLRVWRLPSWPLTRIRPHYEPRGVNCFSLSVLGNDAPLLVRADSRADAEDDAVTAYSAVPQRMTAALLRDNRDRLYGADRSLCIYENGHPIDPSRLIVRELSRWDAALVDDEVAIDPVRGRVMFPERHRQTSITVSSHQGFASAIGGGEYPRPLQNATAGISIFRTGHLVGQGVPFLSALRGSALPFSDWLRTRVKPAVLGMPLDDAAAVERELLAELNRILQAEPFPEDLLPPDLELDAEVVALRALEPRGAHRIRLHRLLLEAVYPDTVHRSFAKVSVSSRGGQRVITDAARSLQNDARPPMTAIIELTDSGLYVEPVVIEVRPFHTLVLRAAEGCRPTILLPERDDDIDDMVISCGDASRVVLDGLMVARRAVRINGNPHDVVIRHCTLVPGWDIDQQCRPEWGTEPSLVVSDLAVHEPWREEGWPDCPPELLTPTSICIDRSIVGSIVVQRDEVDAEPVHLEVRRSIVDATAKASSAISAPGDRRAQAVVSVVDSTVIGRVRVHSIELAENSIFTGLVDSGRRQTGRMRFCFVPPRSRTPRRYACQPDLVIAAAAPGSEADEAARVVPRFLDRRLRYGRPDYCRLDDLGAATCAVEILRGADDEAELGVFHDLYLPLRLDNLNAAIREFLPLGWTHDVVLES